MRERSAGVLLHISSLPSPYGIGDLGPAAHAFARNLAAAGICYWQFLPLTPTSEFIGNSPYSSPSAFAGNPLFISPERLCTDGWLSWADLDNLGQTVHSLQPPEQLESAISPADFESAQAQNYGPEDPNQTGLADYSAAESIRRILLNAAFQRALPYLENKAEFNDFCALHRHWLEDYALFSALKLAQGGSSWTDWPEPLKFRQQDALRDWSEANRAEILRQKFIQYLFYSQWGALRECCATFGLRLVGDLPIYVTHDSADVWANRELFNLDENGQPVTVAGVPPDYFSETGQRWGNPVYDWPRMAEKGFAWWKQRLAHNFRLADLVRLDHFRGFCGYWEIPASEETAVNGSWATAPGRAFFSALRDEFGPNLPIIAEDLGIITDDVRELMAEFKLPGMKVLHFAFGGATPWNNPDAPFRHPLRSVVYTGTHDNTTSRDWYETAPAEERRNFCAYQGREILLHEAPDAMMRLALESASALAVVPMQDILGLGAQGRMNTPSKPQGNWRWRMTGREGWLEGDEDGGSKSNEEAGCRASAQSAAPEINVDSQDGARGVDFSNLEEFYGPEGRLPPMFRRFHTLCRIYGRIGPTTTDGGNNA